MTRLLPVRAAKPVTGFLNDALIVTLAAQILTLPLIAHYFGRLSVVSPLANLLVLPVQPAVMIWGGAAVILSLLSTLAYPRNRRARVHPPLSTLLTPLIRLIMLVPWLALHWTVAVVQTLAVAAICFGERQPERCRVGRLLSHCWRLACWRQAPQRAAHRLASEPSAWRCRVVKGAHVGCYPAARRLPSALRHAQLPARRPAPRAFPGRRPRRGGVDRHPGRAASPDRRRRQSNRAARRAGQAGCPSTTGEIELVVVTHAGDERVGGLLGLAQRYQIGQVVQTPFPYPSAAYGQWLRELQEASVPIAAAEAGMRTTLGYGATLDVLNPGPGPALGKDGELDLKANSLVLRLSWGRTSVLLLGDATRGVQEQCGGGWR